MDFLNINFIFGHHPKYINPYKAFKFLDNAWALTLMSINSALEQK